MEESRNYFFIIIINYYSIKKKSVFIETQFLFWKMCFNFEHIRNMN